MSEFIEIPADIGRVVEGLRDIGYTFPVAVADLVDNSIEAGATAVAIDVYLGLDGRPGVSIVDNGCGMDREGLLNAMRYGAADVDDPSRLGRFGLGLKTASTGFCRSLTLVSTPGGGVPEMFATWDLDVVAEKNKWLYETGEMTPAQGDAFDEARGMLEELAGDRSDNGTLVIWDKVDRLLVKKHGGTYADPPAALRTKTRDLREHLASVFQRYLDSDDDRATNVDIAVNGEKVEPWDPFCEKWEHVKPELQNILQLETPDGEDLGKVLVRGFILPKKNSVPDSNYAKEADISLANQGVYVYRENRMIEGPIWLGLARETHLNQLRVDISYLAVHDEYFVVDVKKKDLKLEPGLDEAITDMLKPLRTEADKRSRGKGTRPPPPPHGGKRPTEVTIDGTKTGLQGPDVLIDGEQVRVTNNRGEGVEIRTSDGVQILKIRIDDEPQGAHVNFADSLTHNVLWEPSLGAGQGNAQVTLSTTHDWYRKTYLPNASNENFVQAIEFLFFALAQAELNNVDLLLHPVLEELRIEVSRNLTRLVADLPEQGPED